MLLDSNLIIYASKSGYSELRDFIATQEIAVSVISYVESLGYHKIVEAEKQLLIAFFTSSVVLPLTQPILDEAVRLRQTRSMKLGDAIIAATALVHNEPLATHNVKDFDWISDLTILDPLGTG